MAFRNPPPATVTLTPGSTLDVSGSQNLGIGSTVSGNIPATATAHVEASAQNTYQLLANSAGTSQYILTSCVVSLQPATNNGAILTIACTGTSSMQLLRVNGDSSGSAAARPLTAQFDLKDLQLPVGAGIAVTLANATASFSVTLYYSTISGTAPAVSGNVIVRGL